MQAMSNSDIAAGATETQQMRIMAPAGVSHKHSPSILLSTDICQSSIRLRMRITFTKGGQNITDQQDFAGFPAELTAAK
jgi:AP-1 complex subunit gamma-1